MNNFWVRRNDFRKIYPIGRRIIVLESSKWTKLHFVKGTVYSYWMWEDKMGVVVEFEQSPHHHYKLNSFEECEIMPIRHCRNIT